MDSAYEIFDEEIPLADNEDENMEEDEESPQDEDDEEDEEARAYQSDESEDPDEDLTGIETRPSYKKANSLRFANLCAVMEDLDKMQSRKHAVKKKWTKEQKLKHLLPPKILKGLKGGSPFPIFRLLMPDRDTCRRTITKEASLANAYCDFLGLDKGTPKYEALKQYTNPEMVERAKLTDKPPPGDLSVIIAAVIKDYENLKPSGANIGDINRALDQLVAGLSESRKFKKGNSGRNESQQWRYSQSQTQGRSPKKQKPKVTHAMVRKNFVATLVDRLKFSPLEHKWLVRILLENIKVGVGFEAILGWYSPHGTDLWKSHNSLKAVCDKLCNAAYVRQRELEIKQAEERNKQNRFSQLYEVPTNPDPIRISNSLSAMKSDRTSFASCMADMAAKHRDVLKKLPKDDPVKQSLALRFPAFDAEVKLDGERMIVHICRGKVTMHTRQGRWYSPLYSPIIGPALRRAVSKYDLDLILDGEILAWDNEANEVVEFGNNRTVAILRQNWLKSRQKIEDIDKRLHDGEKDGYIVEFGDAKNWSFDKANKSEPDDLEGGDSCWIKFVAFDVLLVGGPDAKKALADSMSPDPPPASTGSLVHMSGTERKRILYHLIEEQKNEIEIVESVVIRPNGDCAKAEEYFSSSDPIMECGLPAHTLDSAKWTLNVGHPTLNELDTIRRKERTDLKISEYRTKHVNGFYRNIVDEKKREGLVFKDLAAPYVLRASTGLWRKIKPDYSNDSFASDIDVVIIGGTYAIGRRTGKLSGFLCACVDSQNPGLYMPFCRVNARSLSEEKLEACMVHTGFQDGQLGKWFTEEDHGTSLPDFISKRSLQFGKETQDGWRFDRVKNYPDLFIHPKDSVVLTLNASEIVTSDEYSAGITLRFPRAQRARLDGDEKPAEEVEDEQKLTKMLNEYKMKMKKYATGNSFEIDTSPSKSRPSNDGPDDEVICQFMTAEQFLQKQKQKKRKEKVAGRVKRVREEKKVSNALKGIKFHVVEGSFVFDEVGLDAEQARSEGWFDEAKNVHCASDVETFIMKHGGQALRTASLDVHVVGGSRDFKVKNQIRGMDVLRVKERKKRKGSSKANDVSIPGVLRWTYVLSLVHRWLQEKKRRLEAADSGPDESDDDDLETVDESILTTVPELAEPRFFDYLAQSEQFGDDPFQSIWKYGPLDTTTMKQALSLLQEADQGKSKKQKTEAKPDNHMPWQHSAMECLEEQNRWILSCQYEKLWPYSKHDTTDSSTDYSPAAGNAKPVIVYPDLFGDDFGLTSSDYAGPDLDAAERWERASAAHKCGAMASSLPLLRAMGSLVTFHLSERVTHVLCNLAGDSNSVRWRPGSDYLDVFNDEEHGRKLLKRLDDVVGRPVLLISRAWVNTTFDS